MSLHKIEATVSRTIFTQNERLRNNTPQQEQSSAGATFCLQDFSGSTASCEILRDLKSFARF